MTLTKKYWFRKKPEFFKRLSRLRHKEFSKNNLTIFKSRLQVQIKLQKIIDLLKRFVSFMLALRETCHKTSARTRPSDVAGLNIFTRLATSNIATSYFAQDVALRYRRIYRPF